MDTLFYKKKKVTELVVVIKLHISWEENIYLISHIDA